MNDPSGRPRDRGHLTTEQRLSASAEIDAMSVEQALELMNTQDTAVPVAVRHAIAGIAKLTQAVVGKLKEGGRLIYIGAGTSGRLGVLDASECPPTFFCDPGQVVGIIAGGDAALRKSAEGKEDEPEQGASDLKAHRVSNDDVVVGIAAGGTTPYVWGALQQAKDVGAVTALICCVPLESLQGRDGRLPVEIDYGIELLVGPEVITGSTRLKAGTATKLTLNMITTTTMVQLGKAWGNLMVDLRASNAKLRDRAVRILTTQCEVDRDEAATLLEQAEGRVKVALVMGRLGVQAEEAMRKLEETDGRLRPLIGSPRGI